MPFIHCLSLPGLSPVSKIAHVLFFPALFSKQSSFFFFHLHFSFVAQYSMLFLLNFMLYFNISLAFVNLSAVA